MPVAEAEFELPEIETLDTPFKKRVAFSAAVLVLLGGLLALGASSASEHEQGRAAGAQAESIIASAGYGEAYSQIAELAGGDGEARSLRERAELARLDGSLTGADSYDHAAQAWDESAGALADLAAPGVEGSHFDAVNQEATDLLVEPRVDALRADALRETATAWGRKTDRYVAGITLLAVTLSLLGLSLTVAEGSRRWLVVPAALISLLAGGTSLAAVAQHPKETPDAAVRALADGDRLMTLGRYDDAVDAYSEAIELRPDYAPAYRARASADDQAGSRSVGAYVIATVDPKARARSIVDLDKALALSPVPDYLSLVNQGANLFHVRDYARSEQLTRRALDTNDRLPLPWANLALDQAAQGHEGDARASYEKAIALTLKRPDPLEQAELFSSSRTALEELATQQPDNASMVQRFEEMLVGAQAELMAPGQDPAAPDARMSDFRVSASGMTISADWVPTGQPVGTRVSWIGYFRATGDEPWQQPTSLVAFDRLQDEAPRLHHRTLRDLGCPGPGEYRLDAWVDDRLLATAEATVAAVAPRYLPSYDPSSRVSACRPADWGFDDSVPGRVRLTAPGQDGAQLTVRALPLPAELIGHPADQVARTAVDSRPECRSTGPSSPDVAGHIDSVNGVYRDSGVRADGRIGFCWAGLGNDGLLRVAVAEYDGADPTANMAINDLLSRLAFNDIAAAPAPS